MRRRHLAIVACIAALPVPALAQQPVPPIAPQVREEMWAIPSSPVPMLAYLIRPVDGGPFPLVVMNHGGSLDATGRSYFPAIEFRDAALWFARQVTWWSHLCALGMVLRRSRSLNAAC